eukprot:Hpha_TRINITY_DN11576_c0_g1::TRINITY_DN11576_c0_g1_i1::g.32126::m.32126
MAGGAPRTAAEFAKGLANVHRHDVLRLYKELMKAAMTVSNPKLRMAVYDSIRHEFRVRKHYTDEFAIMESMTRGMSDLDTLKDGRTHPFLYVDEEGVVNPPMVEDPTIMHPHYIPGPIYGVIIFAWGVFGIFVLGACYEGWRDNRNPLMGHLHTDAHPEQHKAIPSEFMGHKVPWKHDPPTGPEITDFRNFIMAKREQEACLEQELLDLEAKCMAVSLTLQKEADAKKK